MVRNGTTAFLNGITGDLTGKQFALATGKTLIGRGRNCQIRITDLVVSREHALIYFSGGRFYIQDQGSTHGTLVNGQPVQSNLLNNGDTITIGNMEFIFQSDVDAEPTIMASEVEPTMIVPDSEPARTVAEFAAGGTLRDRSPEMRGITPSGTITCVKCGASMMLNEELCSQCGAPRLKIPPQFSAVLGSYARLRAQYQVGKLVGAAYEEELKHLVIEDDAGDSWMLGAISGQWYWYNGEDWVRRDPPSSVPVLPVQPPSEVVSPKVPAARRSLDGKWLKFGLVGLLVVSVCVGVVFVSSKLFSFGKGISDLVGEMPGLPAVSTEVALGLTEISPLLEMQPTQIATLLSVTIPSILPTIPVMIEAPPQVATLFPGLLTDGNRIGQVAFSSERTGEPQLYLINVDGSDERKLTDMSGGACQPAWSLDGMQLVFTSPCQGNRREYADSTLWLISLDEDGNVDSPTQLPIGFSGGNYDPAWAPDGERIAFTSLRDGRLQIYAMNLDGSELRNLNDDLGYNRQPTWSPDGSRIAFITARDEVTEVWIMSGQGGEGRRFSYSGNKNASYPDWSKDGQLILFERQESGDIPRLAAVPVEGERGHDVEICPGGTLHTKPMAEPSWSSDGLWIAFETWPDGVNHNIAIMMSNCGQYSELTVDPALDFDPAWRPTP